MGAGVRFVILNCGGSDAGRYRDRKFADWHADCQKLGMPVGAYYYSAATRPDAAMADAEHCLSILAGRRLDYPVWMDVETQEHQHMSVHQPGLLGDTINAFAKTVNEGGYRCGVYSWKWLLDPLSIDGVDRWVCAWTRSKPSGRVDMWQFGGETNVVRSTAVAGYDPIDQDYAYTDYPSMGGWPTIAGGTDDLMLSIDGKNTVVWMCGDAVHDLTHPDDMAVLGMVAKACGCEMPLVAASADEYARVCQSAMGGYPEHLKEYTDKFKPRS
jgi:hypothetical protein